MDFILCGMLYIIHGRMEKPTTVYRLATLLDPLRNTIKSTHTTLNAVRHPCCVAEYGRWRSQFIAVVERTLNLGVGYPLIAPKISLCPTTPRQRFTT